METHIGSSNQAMRDYMRNLFHLIGGSKDGRIYLSPDNARIPLRIDPIEDNSRNSTSSHSSTRIQIMSSPRIRPSRWSNSSPAAVAVEAAVLVSDSNGDSRSCNSFLETRWGQPVHKRSSTSKQACVDDRIRRRTCPKDLLESSMGGSSSLISRRSYEVTSPTARQSPTTTLELHNEHNDRWTGKSPKSAPPSPPFRSSAPIRRKQVVKESNSLDGCDRSPKTTTSRRRCGTPNVSRRKSYDSHPHSRKCNLPVTEKDEISNTTIHTKSSASVLTPEKYHYETKRINNLIQRLPDSLRAPPY
ncbi:hypothetical protein IV203_017979 [Nitzschia inconspicua]|uniref:Uncharacterized protein n=1 Tax=Nitzschia inconspicua TaxID=303405 RepID=A0A9K3M0X8_9STRA|nr:hypothetical protein IV203_017979 [Nitzschia inconspicua]